MIAFLDTHALVGLGLGRVDQFGKESRRLIETADLLVSPIVLLELHVLAELRKVTVQPDRFFAETLAARDIREASDSFAEVVREAKYLAWTRDPYDRLIVGAATLHRAKLITKDTNIREHYDGAVW